MRMRDEPRERDRRGAPVMSAEVQDAARVALATSQELGAERQAVAVARVDRMQGGGQRQQQITDTAAAQQQQLARRLSAPARMRPAESDAKQQGPSDNEHVNSSTSASSSAATTPRLSALECDECSASERNALRHSHRERGHYNNRHRHHHKSASPLSSSSSTASDSAFSQSQTTLGSDSEHCSARSFASCSSGSGRAQKRIIDKDEDSCSSNSADEHTTSATLADEAHFKIVWQNLSYKIPEKRLARLVAGIGELWSRRDRLRRLGLGFGQEDASSDATLARDLEVGGEGGPKLANKQRQVIFSNLNGCVKSGELTAILGPSGAGKTTFLKCLTSSLVEGVSGSISIEAGARPTSSQQQQKQLKLCIIPQKDYLFDNLTVMENLLFASRIKNTQRDFNHKENVHRVAGLLGLHACLKLKTSRLSGGQYKRVSIAQELLSQPDILILDEPTSGLDSLTCFRTVSVLRELVDLSRKGLMAPLAIVMTIHQPQIKIFNLFHHVYILSSLGQCVYEGRPEYLVDTVAEQCKLLPPPDDQNPASFIIDLASEVYGRAPIEQLVGLQLENFNRVHQVGTKSSASPALLQLATDPKQMLPDEQPTSKNQTVAQCKANGTTPEPQLTQAEKLHISDRLKKRNVNNRSFWLHTILLMRRLWISMWRDSLLTTTRVVFHVIIPFVFYFVYSQKSGSANACPHVERELDIQEMVSEANIQRLSIQHDELILTFENVSLFFLLLYSFSMCVLAVTALSFPLNMQILLKETSNGWYTMPRFVMAKTLADLPIELTMPIISISIAYAITGQPSSYLCWRMLAVTAVMTLCSLISQTQGLLFGAYFMNNVQAAVFVSQASTLPWIMLSGFTTRVSELPRILQWLSFGSIYRLGIESIVAVRYGFGMCPCNDELVNNNPPKMVGIPDQLRSVMRYYMESYSASSSDTDAINATATSTPIAPTKPGDIFEKIATTLSRANTYGVDIGSCNDVKPFIMSAREVDETTLARFLMILMSILVGLKVLLFIVVRNRAG